MECTDESTHDDCICPDWKNDLECLYKKLYRRFFNCDAEEPGGEISSSGKPDGEFPGRAGTTMPAKEGERGGGGSADGGSGGDALVLAALAAGGAEESQLPQQVVVGPRGGGGPSGSKRRANYTMGLCSHSQIDSQRSGRGGLTPSSNGGGGGDDAWVRPGCYDCLVGSSNTHGLPGGAACCGTRGNLSRCFRAWP